MTISSWMVGLCGLVLLSGCTSSSSNNAAAGGSDGAGGNGAGAGGGTQCPVYDLNTTSGGSPCGNQTCAAGEHCIGGVNCLAGCQLKTDCGLGQYCDKSAGAQDIDMQAIGTCVTPPACTPGPGPGGGGTTGGSGVCNSGKTSGSAACDACVNSNCCGTLTACETSTSCALCLFDTTCTSDPTALSARSCLAQTCGTACQGTSGFTAGGGGSSAAGPGGVGGAGGAGGSSVVGAGGAGAGGASSGDMCAPDYTATYTITPDASSSSPECAGSLMGDCNLSKPPNMCAVSFACGGTMLNGFVDAPNHAMISGGNAQGIATCLLSFAPTGPSNFTYECTVMGGGTQAVCKGSAARN